MDSCSRCEATHQQLELERARNIELEQELARLQARCAELEAELSETAKLCELQQADLDRYKKAYEASRPNHPERVPREQLQLAFERVLAQLGEQDAANDGEQQDDDAVADDAEPAPARRRGGRQKKRHPHGRRDLKLADLPVVEQRIEPDEVKASGGVGYRLIDEEASERVAFLRAQYVRFRVVRLKYVQVEPGADGESGASVQVAYDGSRIVTAPLPLSVWPNVMGDPSAIAHIIMSKYGDLLPLNRQQSMSERDGFALPKSTQCSWLRPAHALCTPVVDAMADDSRDHAFLIATDATSVPVLPPRLTPEERERAAQLWPVERRECERWHVFVFIADRDHVVFRYDRENTGEVMQRMLEGYRGNLLCDAASVFDVLYREHGMTENGCWFHCRRPFYRALQTDPSRALEALSLISGLFEVDRELRAAQLDLPTFTRLRSQRAGPILEMLDKWVELNRGSVDPRGPLESAIGYYRNQRTALHRFLQDGRIRLDNNLSEQALRSLVVGLSNWTFFANETGLAWYTTFRSLIASCMLHRLNPEIYLEQLLRLVPHWPRNRVLELAPKYWIKTVTKLDRGWQAILARPWEPGVVQSAKLAPPESRGHPSAKRAA